MSRVHEIQSRTPFLPFKLSPEGKSLGLKEENLGFASDPKRAVGMEAVHEKALFSQHAFLSGPLPFLLRHCPAQGSKSHQRSVDRLKVSCSRKQFWQQSGCEINRMHWRIYPRNTKAAEQAA